MDNEALQTTFRILRNIIFQNLCNFIKVWHQITLHLKRSAHTSSSENESGLACFKGNRDI